MVWSHVESEETKETFLRICCGAVVATWITASQIIHSDHGLKKGDSKCCEGFHAPGVIGAGHAERLTWFAGVVGGKPIAI